MKAAIVVARRWIIAGLLGALLGLTFTFAARAQEAVRVTVIAEPQRLTVGDPVRLTLTVTHPADYRLIPVHLAPEWGELEVLDQDAPRISPQVDGELVTTQIITVTAWTPGPVSTPRLTFQMSDHQGELIQLAADPVSLHVLSVLDEGDLALRDIKPQAILAAPPTWPWLAAGILLTLALLVAGARLLRRWREVTPAALAVPAVDDRLPHQVALDELDHIAALDLPREGRMKEHYTLVSDTIRRYLQGLHQIPAMDQTTLEIRRALQLRLLVGEQRHLLFGLLDESDLVKFADFIPEKAQADDALMRARRFVQVTSPADFAETAGPAVLMEASD